MFLENKTGLQTLAVLDADKYFEEYVKTNFIRDSDLSASLNDFILKKSVYLQERSSEEAEATENSSVLRVEELQEPQEPVDGLNEELIEFIHGCFRSFPLMYQPVDYRQHVLIKMEHFLSLIVQDEPNLDEEWSIFCYLVASEGNPLMFLQFSTLLESTLETLGRSDADRSIQSLQYIEIITSGLLDHFDCLFLELLNETLDKEPQDLLYLEKATRSIGLFEGIHLIFVYLVNNLPILPSPTRAIALLHKMLPTLKQVATAFNQVFELENSLESVYIDLLYSIHPHMDHCRFIFDQFVLQFIVQHPSKDYILTFIQKSKSYLSDSYLIDTIVEFFSESFDKFNTTFLLKSKDFDPIIGKIISKLNQSIENDDNLEFSLVYSLELNHFPIELISKLDSDAKSKYFYYLASFFKEKFDDFNELNKSRDSELIELILCLFHKNPKVFKHGFSHIYRKYLHQEMAIEAIISNILTKLEIQQEEILGEINEIEPLPFECVIDNLLHGNIKANTLDSLKYYCLKNPALVKEYLETILSCFAELFENNHVIDAVSYLFACFPEIKTTLVKEDYLTKLIALISLTNEPLNKSILRHLYQISMSKLNPELIGSDSWRHFNVVNFINSSKWLEENAKTNDDFTNVLYKMASVSAVEKDILEVSQQLNQVKSHEEFIVIVEYLQEILVCSNDCNLFLNTIPSTKFSKFFLNKPISSDDELVFQSLCQLFDSIIKKTVINAEYQQLLGNLPSQTLSILVNPQLRDCHPFLISLLNSLSRSNLLTNKKAVSSNVCQFLSNSSNADFWKTITRKGLEILVQVGIHDQDSLVSACNLLKGSLDTRSKNLIKKILVKSENSNLNLSIFIELLNEFDDILDLVIVLVKRGHETEIESILGTSLIRICDSHLKNPRVASLIGLLCISRGVENTLKLFGGFEWLKSTCLSIQNPKLVDLISLVELVRLSKSTDQQLLEWLLTIFSKPFSVFKFNSSANLDAILETKLKEHLNSQVQVLRSKLLSLFLASDFKLQKIGTVVSKVDYSSIQDNLKLVKLLVSIDYDISQSPKIAKSLEKVFENSNELPDAMFLVYKFSDYHVLGSNPLIFTKLFNKYKTDRDLNAVSTILRMLKYPKIKDAFLKVAFKDVWIDFEREIYVSESLKMIKALLLNSDSVKISISKNSQFIESLLLKRKDYSFVYSILLSIFCNCATSKHLFCQSLKAKKPVQLDFFDELIQCLHEGGIKLKIFNSLVISDEIKYFMCKSNRFPIICSRFRKFICEKKWEKAEFLLEALLIFSNSAFSSSQLLKDKELMQDLVTCNSKTGTDNILITLFTRLSLAPEFRNIACADENFELLLVEWIKSSNFDGLAINLVFELAKQSEKTKAILKQSGVMHEIHLKAQLSSDSEIREKCKLLVALF